jgi:hypothetical protein
MLTIQNNQLTFVDGRFYVADDGSHYPSATTILEAYPKPYALLEWMKSAGGKSDEIRDAAGRRGSTVHQLTEDYDKGLEVSLLSDCGTPRYSLEEWSMFERYVNYSVAMEPVNLHIEETLICPSLGFAARSNPGENPAGRGTSGCVRTPGGSLGSGPAGPRASL